jgi:hypothetical protein
MVPAFDNKTGGSDNLFDSATVIDICSVVLCSTTANLWARFESLSLAIGMCPTKAKITYSSLNGLSNYAGGKMAKNKISWTIQKPQSRKN